MTKDVDKLVRLLVRSVLSTDDCIYRVQHLLFKLHESTWRANFRHMMDSLKDMLPEELQKAIGGEDDPKETARRIAKSVWGEWMGLPGGDTPQVLKKDEVIEMPEAETKEVTGLVQAVKMEGQRLAVCIDDTWYSGFPRSFPVLNEGDEATIGFTETKKNGRTYYDIVYVKQASRTNTRATNSNNHRILRSVALKAAATLHAGNTEIEVVLATAEEMCKWLAQSASSEPVSAEA